MTPSSLFAKMFFTAYVLRRMTASSRPLFLLFNFCYQPKEPGWLTGGQQSRGRHSSRVAQNSITIVTLIHPVIGGCVGVGSACLSSPTAVTHILFILSTTLLCKFPAPIMTFLICQPVVPPPSLNLFSYPGCDYCARCHVITVVS